VPKYAYKCQNCGEERFIFHGMIESREEEACGKCGEVALVKKLSKISFSVDKHHTADKKPGTVVNKTISELHEELQSEKEKLKNEMWQDRSLENE
tara:strand:- start:11121 stop:11405 length:285 start_codon:yes stop_codon:yes gene_type:complete